MNRTISNARPGDRICAAAAYPNHSNQERWQKNRDSGKNNHKYAAPQYVRAAELTRDVYSPERFPKMEGDQRGAAAARVKQGLDPSASGPLFQSERDWAYARRALARGEAPETVARAIADFRRDEKVNIVDYVDRTVRKAAASLTIESPTDDGPDR